MVNPNQLLNRSVSRIALHNGVHVSIPGKNGAPARSDVVKCVFSSDPIMARQGKICAKAMTITPLGVFCEFEGGLEKLVPFSNVYEADLIALPALAHVGKVHLNLSPEELEKVKAIVGQAEAAADVLKEVQAIKRGPGRPPKTSEPQGAES